jgi:homoserine acetyltransferase
MACDYDVAVFKEFSCSADRRFPISNLHITYGELNAAQGNVISYLKWYSGSHTPMPKSTPQADHNRPSAVQPGRAKNRG